MIKRTIIRVFRNYASCYKKAFNSTTFCTTTIFRRDSRIKCKTIPNTSSNSSNNKSRTTSSTNSLITLLIKIKNKAIKKTFVKGFAS